MPKAKVDKAAGAAAKARWAFYKRLTELGCVYCPDCRCYQYLGHQCEGLTWIHLNASTFVAKEEEDMIEEGVYVEE